MLSNAQNLEKILSNDLIYVAGKSMQIYALFDQKPV